MQMAAQMRESSKRPQVEPSGSGPPPSSTGTTSGEASATPVGAAAAAIPLPYASDVFDIRHTLETVMTVQVAHDQLLVDMLDEFRALRVDLVHLRRLPSPPPFEDGL